MATAPAFTPAALQVRSLQKSMNQTLKTSGQNYETLISLGRLAKLELQWWLNNIEIRNGKPIRILKPDLIISSDAAGGQKGGWGAHCEGKSTGGEWTLAERQQHINVLELKAALLAIKTFTKQTNPRAIHLLIDNQVALAHLVKMGLTLISLTKEIWSYLLAKGITLTAEYIPSELNTEADYQSRNVADSSEWMLDKQMFNRIAKIWESPCMDLFASRTSHQIQNYYSWKPDPNCIAVTKSIHTSVFFE